MSSPTDRIIVLIINHLEQSITEAERHELEEWMNESSLNKEAVATFLEEEKLHEGIRDMYQMRQKVWDRLQKQLDIAKVVPLRPKSWWRYAAAASILLLLSVGTYFIFNNKATLRQAQGDIAKAKQFKNDIAPGGNKATLTLANGKQIILDSALNGTLAQQGNTTVVKLDSGELAYNGASNSTEILYNTITTPKGGQYQLVLADGSKVWLNAASSLRYPTSFTGKERNVEMTGEIYFEVTKNAAMPFHVKTSGQEITVLGTHFNVNAYGDENPVRTTLLEGSVKVTGGSNVVVIKPGQQANLKNNGDLGVTDNVDVDEVMAWKNGLFYFNGTDLKIVMQQIARWYDVDVVYQGAIPRERLDGKIPKKVNASAVLGALGYTGIHFKIEGKKIIVMP